MSSCVRKRVRLVNDLIKQAVRLGAWALVFELIGIFSCGYFVGQLVADSAWWNIALGCAFSVIIGGYFLKRIDALMSATKKLMPPGIGG